MECVKKEVLTSEIHQWLVGGGDLPLESLEHYVTKIPSKQRDGGIVFQSLGVTSAWRIIQVVCMWLGGETSPLIVILVYQLRSTHPIGCFGFQCCS